MLCQAEKKLARVTGSSLTPSTRTLGSSRATCRAMSLASLMQPSRSGTLPLGPCPVYLLMPTTMACRRGAALGAQRARQGDDRKAGAQPAEKQAAVQHETSPDVCNLS